MLYLEDFIELIEQLPQDLRDRFTDMRELDLKVQNTIDTLDTRVRKLFSDARKGKAEETDREYNSIHSSYKQALDDAGEKVLMASQVYDLVDRHLRKLDQELGRFKMELEADCSGITEILERRSTTNEDSSLDLLYNKDSTNNHKRKFGDIERLSTANLTNGGTSSTEKSLTGIFTSLAASYASAKPTPTPPAAATGKQNGISSLHHSKSSPSLSTDSSKDGRGAQAILNAMTAAQKKAEKLGNSLSLSGLMAPSSSSSSHKQSSSSQSYIDVTGYQSSSSQKSSQSSQSSRIPKSGRRAHKNMGGSQGDSKYPGPSIDWVPDPNEPTYCICNQVSYGEMVGCDNNSCPIEWFHYGCVGLTDAPKGKWYCRDCSVQIKKKRMR